MQRTRCSKYKKTKLRDLVKVLILLTNLPWAKCGKGCSKDDWTNVFTEKKYIKLVNTAMSQANATTYCESVGGQLLIVRSVETFAAVLQLISNCKIGYRIGLTKTENNELMWIDGHLMTENDYKPEWGNGTSPSDETTSCVSFHGCSKKFWKHGSCTTKLPFICEAAEPCAARPVLNVNRGRRLENVSVNVTGKAESRISCYIGGYQNYVTRMYMSCNKGKEYTGEKEVAKPYYIDIHMHKKKCTCTAVSRDGKKETSEITLLIVFNPQLAENQNNGSTFLAQRKMAIVIKFKIIANPTPNNFTLRKNGSELCTLYTLDLDTVAEDHPFSVQVNIIIDSVNDGHDGKYSMHVDNGLPPSLYYAFSLSVFSSDDKPKKVTWSVQLALIVSACIVGGAMLYFGGGSRKASESDSTARDGPQTVSPESTPTPSFINVSEHGDVTEKQVKASSMASSSSIEEDDFSDGDV